MNTAKVTISIHPDLLRQIDSLVLANVFQSRSQAFQIAVEDTLKQSRRSRLEAECLKLNPSAEQAEAELGCSYDLAQWPEY